MTGIGFRAIAWVMLSQMTILYWSVVHWQAQQFQAWCPKPLVHDP